LQLTITGDAETLTVDSRIAGFESLAECAIVAARKKGLKLDPTTLYNFQSLGLSKNEIEGMEAVENRR
jgi:hypothetical protein